MNKILSYPLIGNLLLKLLIRLDGGEIYSKRLRKYAKEVLNIECGLYTYGPWWKKGFNNGGSIKIGNYCSIANEVQYFGANHPIKSFSTSAIFYNKVFGYDVEDVKRNHLEIGHDVWIASGVKITSGCKRIGTGAIIGAGTVVTKDIPPYAIVVGVPGKVINYRFKEQIIQELLLSKWWEKKPKDLLKGYKYKEDISIFLKKINDNINS